jgi:hypothetical protein
MDTCADSKRILAKKGWLGDNSDVDGCVGAIFNAWVGRVAANAANGSGTITVPGDDVDKEIEKANAAQREAEKKAAGGTAKK